MLQSKKQNNPPKNYNHKVGISLVAYLSYTPVLRAKLKTLLKSSTFEDIYISSDSQYVG